MNISVANAEMFYCAEDYYQYHYENINSRVYLED